MSNASIRNYQNPTEHLAATRANPDVLWNTITAARLGYLEASRGRPFSPLYDGESQQWQTNYEIGRLWAVSFLAVEGSAPAWKTASAIPKALSAHTARVCLTGSAPSIPHRRT